MIQIDRGFAPLATNGGAATHSRLLNLSTTRIVRLEPKIGVGAIIGTWGGAVSHYALPLDIPTRSLDLPSVARALLHGLSYLPSLFCRNIRSLIPPPHFSRRPQVQAFSSTCHLPA